MILLWCVGIVIFKTCFKEINSIQIIDEIYNELVDTVNIDKNLLYQFISQTIPRASEIESIPNPIVAGNYVFDLSSPCPIGWAISSDGKKCINSAYNSKDTDCSQPIDIEDSTPIDKFILATRCGLEYPLLDICVRDYSLPCPEDWRLKGKYCIAPSDYSGNCVKIKDFNNLTVKQRADWAGICGVNWPCSAVNYDKACPEDWAEDEQFCYAPYWFTGNLDNKIGKGLLSTLAEKQEFSIKNHVFWPKTAENHESEPLFDDTLCPIGWIPSESICKAPEGYRGPCGNTLPHAKSVSEKIKLSDLCSVRWYKLDGNVVDLNLELSDCPYGWELVDNLCVAPDSYDGPCQVSIDMRDFTKEMKRIWSQVCNAYFVANDITPRKSLSQHYDYRGIVRDLEHLLSTTDDMLERKTIESELNKAKQHAIKNLKLFGGSRFIQIPEEPPRIHDLECPIGWVKLDEKRCLAPPTFRLLNDDCPSILSPQAEARRRLHLKDSNRSVGCNIELPCKTCIKDYVTSKCPVGWTFDPSNSICISPRNYPERLKRLCGDRIQFKYATPTVRRQWELACESEFPCAQSCAPDYSIPCPKGFKLKRISKRGQLDVAVCQIENPNSLKTSNVVRQCLGNNGTLSIILNDGSKEVIHKTCNVDWPCAYRCSENYWQTCPYDWIQIDNYCISPRSYQPVGDCPLRISVEELKTPMDKFKFSLKCLAKWPCVDYCQQDFSKECPSNWLESETECTNPLSHMPEGISKEDYQNANGCSKIDKKSTFMERQEFAFRCRVSWPCGGSETNPPNPDWQAQSIGIDKNWEDRGTIRFYSTF